MCIYTNRANIFHIDVLCRVLDTEAKVTRDIVMDRIKQSCIAV